ncbi:MAG: hypothetical protein KC588_01655 [Nitrospira sp.]|nr:hypothetical protein [Nitrospira sp.]
MRNHMWRAMFVGMMMGTFWVGTGWAAQAWAQMEGGIEAAEHFQPRPSNKSSSHTKKMERSWARRGLLEASVPQTSQAHGMCRIS